jgi:hypothetical protein
MTTTQLAVLMFYRALLIGSLMYVVGYLDWSAWWLLLLAFIPMLDTQEKSHE